MRACLCCGHKTISSAAADFRICRECHWEDDPIAYDKPDFVGGANRVSLNQARQNCAAHGYSFDRDEAAS